MSKSEELKEVLLGLGYKETNIEENVFDEEQDDDISDITEDYKNLVIVDEEDLDSEQ